MKATRKLLILMLLVTFMLVWAIPTGAQTGALFEPPDGTKLLFIGQDIDSINNYVSSTGVTPGGHVTYTSINEQEGIHKVADNGAGKNYLDSLAANYPDSTIQLAIWIKGQLQNIIDNTPWGAVRDYNERMDTLIDTLVAYNRPVFIRWGYEFDGPWNENDPEKYKAAWIRMWDRITLKGAHDKIAMVWQGSAWPEPYLGYPVSAWYPGDQYVDWVGVSIFTPQDTNPPWYKVQEITDFAIAHSKPVMICESTPQRYEIQDLTYSPNTDGTGKVSKTADQIWNEWFVPYFNYINNNPNVVKGVTYINADWDSQRMWGTPYRSGYWGDSRVQANTAIKNNWLNIINGSNWWNASSTLFNNLGYVQ